LARCEAATATYSFTGASTNLSASILTMDLWTDHQGFEGSGFGADSLTLRLGSTILARLTGNTAGRLEDAANGITVYAAVNSSTPSVAWGAPLGRAMDKLPTLEVRLAAGEASISIAKDAALYTKCEEQPATSPCPTSEWTGIMASPSNPHCRPLVV